LLGQQCEWVGIRRSAVTDRGVKAAGMIDTVLDALGHAGTVTSATARHNPNEAAVREAVSANMKGACDGIVAAGGASSNDLAEGAAVCATHGGAAKPCRDRRRSRSHQLPARPQSGGNRAR
jgi:4-hydroxybutyrate dehydrogenase